MEAPQRDLELQVEPPIPPPGGFPGTKIQHYILDRRCIFKPPRSLNNRNPAAQHSDFRKLYYYQGKILQRVGFEKATFIAFSDEALALRLCEWSNDEHCPTHEPHFRALCPRFFGFDNNVGRFLVKLPSFDSPSFDSFLLEPNNNVFLRQLKARSPTIPGNPGIKGAYEAREIAEGLAFCHEEGLSCSLMDGIGLVKCGDKVKFIVNDCKGGLNQTQWDHKVKNNIGRFQESLARDFFPLKNQYENWKQRTSFFQCFPYIDFQKDPQLKLITHHGFLKHDMKLMVGIIEGIQHGIYTRDFGTFQIDRLEKAIISGKLDAECLNKKEKKKNKEVMVWTVDGSEFSLGLMKIFTFNNNHLRYDRRRV